MSGFEDFEEMEDTREPFTHRDGRFCETCMRRYEKGFVPQCICPDGYDGTDCSPLTVAEEEAMSNDALGIDDCDPYYDPDIIPYDSEPMWLDPIVEREDNLRIAALNAAIACHTPETHEYILLETAHTFYEWLNNRDTTTSGGGR